MTTSRERSCNARAVDGVEPDASGSEDHDSVAGADVSGVQDGAGASHNAAAEQRSLGERKLRGYDRELVLVDERLFGETSEPEALKQTSPVSGQARGIGRPAQRRLWVFALVGPAG